MQPWSGVLESRCPLLDYRVYELAWRLPMALKRRHGTGKWILKQLAYNLVNRELLERPKAGFGVPMGEWLRGPLQAWGEDLLDAGRLRQQGFLASAPIRAAWNAHLTGNADNTLRLWNVLMFEAWLEEYHNAPRAASGQAVECGALIPRLRPN